MSAPQPERTDRQQAADRQWEQAKKDIPRHDKKFQEKHGNRSGK